MPQARTVTRCRLVQQLAAGDAAQPNAQHDVAVPIFLCVAQQDVAVPTFLCVAVQVLYGSAMLHTGWLTNNTLRASVHRKWQRSG